MKPNYPIGTVYKTRGKVSRTCVVIDILKTYNSKLELVKIRYVTTHDFLGQAIIDSDVCETTIAMGNPALPDSSPKVDT